LDTIRAQYRQLESLDPEVRKSIKKAIDEVHVICSNWLKKSRGESVQTKASVLFISGLVREMSTQMSDAFSNDFDMSFEYSLDAFAVVDRVEFASIIKNLITNSAHALGNRADGRILIRIQSTDAEVLMDIEDNGPGIPDAIRSQLGKVGITTKKQGSGLGIFHAKEWVESWGGSLELPPQKSGTLVRIKLPRAATPPWFTGQIVVGQNDTVAIFDDSEQVRATISSKFRGSQHMIEVLKLSTKEDLEKLLATKDASKIRFLFDQYLSEELRGLDLIETFKLASRSILVTSADDDEELQMKAQKVGVRIFPKSMIRDAVIRFE
jgi:hypothetical protein